MASLPSVAVSGNKLEPEFRRFSSSYIGIEKSSSYQRITTFVPSERNPDFPSFSFQEAISILQENRRIETGVYVPLLQGCIKKNSIQETEMLHAHMIKTGIYQDLFLTTFLINVYAKCGNMKDARKIFDGMSQRNVVTWTALMTGYVTNSLPELAAKLFIELMETGSYPTNYTLGAVLNASSLMYSVELGKQIHAYSIKYGIMSDTSIGNSFCSLYSKCRRLESAIKVFERILEKNVISWTTIISACSDNGDAEMGLKFFIEMLEKNIEPNEFTFTSVLSSCCILQALHLGEQLHSLCIKYGCEPNLPVRNSIMYLYLKCGRINDSRRLFDEMEILSLVTWNAMIAGHAQMMDQAKDDLVAHKNGIDALKIFLKMYRLSMEPDLFTISSVLTVCSNLVALEQGEQVHALTIKSGYLSDVVVGSALVNMYNKCGSIEKASKAFVEMPARTLISWTSMITGLAQNGRADEALHLFEDMRLAGVKPNKVTFVGVLSACSHAGMVDKALSYFDIMRNEYRLKPTLEHYSCLIDMFVRLGKLDEAFDLIDGMDIEPNEFIWSILVAGCRSHGNVELGFYAAEKLMELKPKDTETCILLMNMYLKAERFKDVSKVRKMMKDSKLGSLRDMSWISIKGKVYSFTTNDTSHFQSVEIQKFLDDLIQKSKQMGFKEEMNPEQSEEEENHQKETRGTVYQSEMLAISFGLMNTLNDASIRVIKNTGMSRDSHNAMKFISILTRREIVVRDSKRLHKFRNGLCSCGDFGSLR